VNEVGLRNLAPLLPVLRSSLEELAMSTILLIILIILLFAALPTFPYSMHHNPGQLAPMASSGGVTPPKHDPYVRTQIVTSRVHRTWLDRLKLWRHAYQTKISDSRREVTGRGASPEASQEAAERRWVEEQPLTH
jgi:hypothetical protein